MAEWSRWDKYKRAPWRQDSSASVCDGWWQATLGQPQEQTTVGWSQDAKKVIDAVERYTQVIVKIDLVESLLRPEKLEISLRYVLKHATYGSSNIFELFDTAEKPNHFGKSRRRWLESQGSNDARQENGRNEWYDLAYQGANATATLCPNSTQQTPLLQQSS